MMRNLVFYIKFIILTIFYSRKFKHFSKQDMTLDRVERFTLLGQYASGVLNLLQEAGVVVDKTRSQPYAGGNLILSSHRGTFLDPFLVYACCTYIAVPIVYYKLFRIPFFKTILHGVGAIPVGTPTLNSKARHKAVSYLIQGMPLLVFPEGKRSRDGGDIQYGAWKWVDDSNMVVRVKVINITYSDGSGRFPELLLTKGSTITITSRTDYGMPPHRSFKFDD